MEGTIWGVTGGRDHMAELLVEGTIWRSYWWKGPYGGVTGARVQLSQKRDLKGLQDLLT